MRDNRAHNLDNVDRSMADILKAAGPPLAPSTGEHLRREDVVHTQAVALVKRKTEPLYEVGCWMRYLTYADMMEMSREMHALMVEKPVSTPEEIAALLHSWAVQRTSDRNEGAVQ